MYKPDSDALYEYETDLCFTNKLAKQVGRVLPDYGWILKDKRYESEEETLTQAPELREAANSTFEALNELFSVEFEPSIIELGKILEAVVTKLDSVPSFTGYEAKLHCNGFELAVECSFADKRSALSDLQLLGCVLKKDD